jgi:hypothetical protein
MEWKNSNEDGVINASRSSGDKAVQFPARRVPIGEWLPHLICSPSGFRHFERNCCGGITYKFCARVEMMSSVSD